jgi:hypothetical protein
MFTFTWKRIEANFKRKYHDAADQRRRERRTLRTSDVSLIHIPSHHLGHSEWREEPAYPSGAKAPGDFATYGVAEAAPLQNKVQSSIFLQAVKPCPTQNRFVRLALCSLLLHLTSLDDSCRIARSTNFSPAAQF